MSANQHPALNTPQAWLARAHSDLALSRAGLTTPGVFWEDVCFHAQQCAEKALKALLLHQEIEFPRTHSIALLLDLLKAADIIVPDAIDEAFVLSQYAVATRYPGAWNPVDDDETRAALALAAQVVEWVEAQVEPNAA